MRDAVQDAGYPCRAASDLATPVADPVQLPAVAQPGLDPIGKSEPLFQRRRLQFEDVRVPLTLVASFQAAGLPARWGHMAGFATIGVGAVGCVVAGKLADRLGRVRVTVWSMAVSGGCALVAGFFLHSPWLLAAVCLVWGFAVVADSAQFSTAVSELTDPRYVGTALTLQTSIGFLLTLLTIRLVPTLQASELDPRFVYAFLALGPAFGIVSMLKLRAEPEATKMAGGNR